MFIKKGMHFLPHLPHPRLPLLHRNQPRRDSCLIPGSLSHHLGHQQKIWVSSSCPRRVGSGMTSQTIGPNITLRKHHVKIREILKKKGDASKASSFNRKKGFTAAKKNRYSTAIPKNLQSTKKEKLYQKALAGRTSF